ncbi:MAG TPA: ATP-binding protein [Terriglobales bacterium]|nr:ATP-binding protein [Terriglobales bacterium]
MPDITRIVGTFVAEASARPAWQRYCIALLAPLLAAFLTGRVLQLSHYPFFSLFSLAVVISSIFGGMRPGFVATVIACLVNLFSAPPFDSIRLAQGQDFVRVLVFGLAGFLIALFVGATGELERRLLLERTRLSVTLQSIGDAVIATDVEGCITFMNPIAEQATGWKLTEASGLPLENVFRIVNESTRLTAANPVRRVLAEGRIIGLANHTVLIRKDSTEIPIDDSAAPIRSNDAIVGVILVFRDITESKVSQAALVHAEKLATVGKLASTIAHEINNPLEAVSNLLFLVAHDESLSHETRHWVSLAESELARVSDMAKQTLSFHRGETKLANIPVRDLIQSVFVLYRSRAANRGVELRNDLSEDTTVFGIAGQLRQLVSNLVTNAIDAMPDGGQFRASAERIQRDGSSLMQLSFSDTGQGIAPDHLRRIFEPFFTTKAHVGTGLGLWITKRIVEDHGGEISVRSDTSSGASGTTFIVSLPESEAKAVRSAG